MRDKLAQVSDISVVEAAAAMLDGTLTVQHLVEACQARCRRFNSRFRAFSHSTPERLLPVEELQSELSNEKRRSALHGIPVSVKGNIPVASLPWTEGSAIFANRFATIDAAIVSRVRESGGVILGTTTLSELAMYGVRNTFEPLALNPWDVNRTAGGSSSGAGVAACLGMAMINIGTDSGGSIRNPACHSGVVGFMASGDTLPNANIPTYVPSFPSLGLIARHVSDVVLAYQILSSTPTRFVMPTLRLLVPRDLIDEMCDEETLALFDETLDRLKNSGVVFINSEFTSWRYGEKSAGVISLYESSRALVQLDYTKASQGLRLRREKGMQITAQEYNDARNAVAEMRRELFEALLTSNADAIVSPTWPFAAPLIDADNVVVRGEQVAVDPHRNVFVRAANAAGAAAVTLPMGIYPSAKVPAGLHLLAAPGTDHRLLALATYLERLLPSVLLAPPLANGQTEASDRVNAAAL